MEKIKSFFKLYLEELNYKVSWPTYKELQGSTILVLVSSVIFAVIIGLMDYGFRNIMSLIYKSF
ncbi:MAG: preprotein translocase subunit SecE [Bacteroidetes bacterium RIFCSPLOWO2_02_FULL_36_8]|nr:MAG: preprotein translocase subunit SecE [Bacteroidetes bacterium RIFCSPLOWO2_02_FULL_36_8]OFY70072.1 MAG: preprotein translocase subunit SecE [Bacteroidetes bacterium RIFCSPLOWO2_12_FULL_37_12]